MCVELGFGGLDWTAGGSACIGVGSLFQMRYSYLRHLVLSQHIVGSSTLQSTFFTAI